MDSLQIENDLYSRLVAVRLAKNISQETLSKEAGVSRRTISRMENGEGVSLNTFVRIMLSLGLRDQLVALIPDTTIRPIDRVRLKGERKHASSPRNTKDTTDWEWGDSP